MKSVDDGEGTIRQTAGLVKDANPLGDVFPLLADFPPSPLPPVRLLSVNRRITPLRVANSSNSSSFRSWAPILRSLSAGAFRISRRPTQINHAV